MDNVKKSQPKSGRDKCLLRFRLIRMWKYGLTASNNLLKPNLMFSISHKTKTLIFFSIFYLNGHAQDKISKDTINRVVICHSTLSYPSAAQDNNIFGIVVVLFDIDSNCRLVNIRIEKGIGYGCDEEAVKALKKCKPIFIGAKRNCTPLFNLRQPFTFRNPDND